MNDLKLYRFSPIKSKEELFKAINYVLEQTTILCKKITGEQYPINPVTIFAHYLDEFEFLKKSALEIGDQFNEHNGPFVKLRNPFNSKFRDFTELRIRIPDPYRSQVGCNDFIVPDYDKFKETFVYRNPHNLREIIRPDYKMIEFFDSDFDVLAYITSGDVV